MNCNTTHYRANSSSVPGDPTKFYLIAIMFLVFDVELLFLYPWAVIAYSDPPVDMEFKLFRFWGVMIFLALLTVGYVYDWRKGVFKWR